MKYILKVENLENVPNYSPMLAMDTSGNFIMREYPNGPATNEIWYWGDYYNLAHVISVLKQHYPYKGPRVLSNELVGDKYVITFDGPVTKLGIVTIEGEPVEFYPIFMNESESSITCNITEIEVPNSITSIGDQTFYSCTSLTSMIIPESVTNIGDMAFSGCTGLTSMTIPNSITNIGQGAFYYCMSLISMSIGNSVNNIGSYAISFCPNLTTITCEAVEPPTLNNDAFYNINQNYIIYVPADSIDEYRSNWSTYSEHIQPIQ